MYFSNLASSMLLTTLAVLQSVKALPFELTNATFADHAGLEAPITSCVALQPGTIYNGLTGETMKYEDFLPTDMSIAEYTKAFGSPFHNSDRQNQTSTLETGLSQTLYAEANCQGASTSVAAMQQGQCYSLWIGPTWVRVHSVDLDAHDISVIWVGSPASLKGLCGDNQYVWYKPWGCRPAEIDGSTAIYRLKK